MIKVKCKVNYEDDSKSFTINSSNTDMDIYEFRDEFIIPLLIGIGYQYKTIQELFCDED